MSLKINRLKYASMYGPTTGDKVRLADTDLIIEIEKDYTVYGDEAKFGGGKTIRDGMAQSATAIRDEGVLDFVITSVMIIDHSGIFKADIGIKNGRIVGIGKAGNPDTMDGITSNMVPVLHIYAMLIQQKQGNLKDFDTHQRPVDWLDLEWFEMNKRILTRTTRGDTLLNLKFLRENPQYTEGDVLFENELSIIAIHILPCEVIVIKPRNAYEIAAVCYEIGNRHVPLFMDEPNLLVPFEVPLFKILSDSNYIVLKENKQLLKQLKTSVLPHMELIKSI